MLHPSIPARGVRVQRPRRKGATMPEGTIYVGRPTLWGNPFMSRRWGHAKSVILHRRWLHGELAALALENMDFSLGEVEAICRLRIRVLDNISYLHGRDLACWCPLASKWCHAETLLDLATTRQRIAA